MPEPPDQRPAPGTLLRSRAEERVRHAPPDARAMSIEELQGALHELHVHQIELEMQNDQLRATQAELEKARERYVDLYDYAPVGYLTIDGGGLILAANLTSVGMLGVDRSYLLRQPFSRFVVKADQDSFYLCLRKALASALTQACEVGLQAVGGAEFPGRLEMLQASEAAGQVCHITLSDITEHKRADEALRENQRRQLLYENEERMRLALEAGELGAWDHDLQTGHIVCSERARTILGLPLGVPITWESVLERLHPDDRTAFLLELDKSMQHGGESRVEVIFRLARSEGGTRWVRFVARCFSEPGAGGPVVHRRGVFADITRQKEAQEVLESRAQLLEVLVRERTARLQDAVAELEHFSYTLAHDLRAPLRAIRGFGDLLLEELPALSPVPRRYLDRCFAAAARMDQLIVDALNYSKLVHQDFKLIPIDAAALLRDVLESYPQFQAATANISVVGPIPAVLGNPALLTQCLSNLLSNALKFIPAGRPPEVRIFAQDLESRVRIWVEDNGIGIADDCRERIFGMFQRLNHAYEGTGIGLALVKKAVERMGGAVGVESQPGKGSRFWIELNAPLA